MLSNAQKEINKEFTFTKASKEENFTFKVDDNSKKVIINFEGEISQGSLRIKITDPNGNKVSGFSLVCSGSINTGSAYSSGSNSRSRNRSRSRSRSSSSSSSSSGSSSSSNVSVNSTDGDVSISVDIGDSDTIKIKNSKTHIYTYQSTVSDDGEARGVINKEIKNPTPGIWKFSIQPKNTSGKLTGKITYK